jgi:hypothetical protein
MIQYQPVLQEALAGDSVPERSGVRKRAFLISHSVETHWSSNLTSKESKSDQ